MNTPEGILIEDGELTIHVRKASKVSKSNNIISILMPFSLEVKKQKWPSEAIKIAILSNVTDVLWR